MERTKNMLTLKLKIEKIIQLKKELDALRPLKKEDEKRIMQKFRLDWNYHSNHIEGNTLTYGETKALLLFGITAQGKPLKDHLEITGHNEAIQWIMEVVKEKRPLTENFIRQLHELILKEPYEIDAITPDGQPTKKKVEVGKYKTTPNHVKTVTGEIFYFASPEETPALMHDLMQWYREKAADKQVNPILLAAEFHYKFIRIHPFDDGNGRTVRILMNFILMQFGYPPVIIKTEDKKNYLAALRQADAGTLEPFIQYIADNLNHSLELMIKAASGESIEEPDDIDKEISLLAQRLETISSSLDVSKSKENILWVYDHSVVRARKKFIEKGKLFEKFYVTADNGILISPPNFVSIYNSTLSAKDDQLVDDKRVQISEYTEDIRIYFNYKVFKRKGFKEFNHTSKIEFIFNSTGYEVKNTNEVSIKKSYGEPLSEEEINQLVNSEIREHKQLIEAKIEELKKN